MTKIILADGAEVKFDGVNGNNFIVPEQTSEPDEEGQEEQEGMDVSIFTDENLASGKVIDDDGNEYPFTNLSFTQQQKQADGRYYICFHEKTAQDIYNEEVEDLIVKIAEIEVSAGNLELEDIQGSLQDEVRVKINDDKWIDK